MIVAVTGSRKYRNKIVLYRTLDKAHIQHGFDGVIHGDAWGADDLADQWCRERGVQPIALDALWDYWRSLGKLRIAGPVRNRVISLLKPRYLFAFPGGIGTWNCVQQCALNFIEIVDCDGARWNDKLRAEGIATGGLIPQ